MLPRISLPTWRCLAGAVFPHRSPTVRVPLRATGDRSGWGRVDAFPGGVGWQPYPTEGLRRTSHVLETTAGAMLVDPLDIPDLDTLLEGWGPVTGVVVLQTQHARDAGALATRFDVPLHLPEWVSIDPNPTAPIHTHTDSIPGTEFRFIETVRFPFWDEAALSDGDTLIVGDALGTARHFRAPDETIGLHPLLRFKRPTVLRDRSPERVLVGHGTGVLHDAAAALETAFTGARRNLPAAGLNGLRLVLGRG